MATGNVATPVVSISSILSSGLAFCNVPVRVTLPPLEQEIIKIAKNNIYGDSLGQCYSYVWGAIKKSGLGENIGDDLDNKFATKSDIERILQAIDAFQNATKLTKLRH